MTNRSRDKGTRAETALVRWLRDNDYPNADRAPLRGHHDTGDITGLPGLVVSVKMRRADVRPDFSKWLRDLDVMRDNAHNLPAGLLVVTRTGYPDPGRWYAIQQVADWFDLYGDLI